MSEGSSLSYRANIPILSHGRDYESHITKVDSGGESKIPVILFHVSLQKNQRDQRLQRICATTVDVWSRPRSMTRHIGIVWRPADLDEAGLIEVTIAAQGLQQQQRASARFACFL